MYKTLDSTRNQTLSDNWETRQLAGPSAILPALTPCWACIESVLNILTDEYKWESKRASSQVLGRGYWRPEAVLCSVHAIITKLATSGGKMLARPLLLGRCPSFIPSSVHPFQGIQSVFTLITNNYRCEISHGIDYLRSCTCVVWYSNTSGSNCQTSLVVGKAQEQGCYQNNGTIRVRTRGGACILVMSYLKALPIVKHLPPHCFVQTNISKLNVPP